VEFAGAGAAVPIPGFGNLLARGVKKAIDERGLIGVITGGATAMAGGLTVAVVFGYLAGLVGAPTSSKQ